MPGKLEEVVVFPHRPQRFATATGIWSACCSWSASRWCPRPTRLAVKAGLVVAAMLLLPTGSCEELSLSSAKASLWWGLGSPLSWPPF